MVMADGNYYLGIDAGGTKTVARVVDEAGNILGEGLAAGANPHNIELEEALGNLGAAMLAAKDKADSKMEGFIHSFTGSCIGLAGLDTEDDRAMVVSGLKVGIFKKLCNNGLVLVNDGLICLRSGIKEHYGASIISGTGSNVYGINRDGKEAFAGNWSWLLGDQGSGFAMGLRLLRQVMKEYDGRSEVSGLSEKVLEFLNFSGMQDLIRWAYSAPVPVREIANLTRLLNDPEVAELPIVDLVIEEAVDAQQDAYRAVVEQLSLKKEEFCVVLAGGLMRLEAGNFTEKLEVAVKEVTPKAKVGKQKGDNVHGAIMMAREAGEEFYRRFLVNWE